MVVPAHVGLEHPNLLWLVGLGILSFVAGLLVNLSRSADTSDHDTAVGDTTDRAASQATGMMYHDSRKYSATALMTMPAMVSMGPRFE